MVKCRHLKGLLIRFLTLYSSSIFKEDDLENRRDDASSSSTTVRKNKIVIAFRLLYSSMSIKRLKFVTGPMRIAGSLARGRGSERVTSIVYLQLVTPPRLVLSGSSEGRVNR